MDEVRTKGDCVKEWLFSAKPEIEEGESSNLNEFKEVDQDSDVEKKDVEGGVSCLSDDNFKEVDQDSAAEKKKKKMVDVEGGVSLTSHDHFKKAFDQDSDAEKKKMVDIGGGVSCSFDDHPPLNLDHFKNVDQDSGSEKMKGKEAVEGGVSCSSDPLKKAQDFDLEEKEKVEALKTQILAQLDDMKFMVWQIKEMVMALKTLGNSSSSSSSEHVNSSGSRKVLDLIDEEVSKISREEEAGFGGSKVVSILREILLVADGLMGQSLSSAVVAGFEELERLVEDSLPEQSDDSDDKKSVLAELRALKEGEIKGCEKEVKEIGPLIKELKEEVISFGKEHESVILAYIKTMKQRVAGTHFEAAKLEMQEWEGEWRRRTNLPQVHTGHQKFARAKDMLQDFFFLSFFPKLSFQ